MHFPRERRWFFVTPVILLIIGWVCPAPAVESDSPTCSDESMVQVAAADTGTSSTGETAPPSGDVQERAVPRTGPGVPGVPPIQKQGGTVMRGKRVEALPGYVLQQGPNNQVTARRAGGGPGATTMSCGCDTQDGSCTLLVQGGIATCDNTSGATCKGTCQFTIIITGAAGIRIQ